MLLLPCLHNLQYVSGCEFVLRITPCDSLVKLHTGRYFCLIYLKANSLKQYTVCLHLKSIITVVWSRCMVTPIPFTFKRKIIPETMCKGLGARFVVQVHRVFQTQIQRREKFLNNFRWGFGYYFMFPRQWLIDYHLVPLRGILHTPADDKYWHTANATT
jgi:hypothetical protein